MGRFDLPARKHAMHTKRVCAAQAATQMPPAPPPRLPKSHSSRVASEKHAPRPCSGNASSVRATNSGLGHSLIGPRAASSSSSQARARTARRCFCRRTTGSAAAARRAACARRATNARPLAPETSWVCIFTECAGVLSSRCCERGRKTNTGAAATEIGALDTNPWCHRAVWQMQRAGCLDDGSSNAGN